MPPHPGEGASEASIQRAVLSHWRSLGVPGSLVAAIPNAGALGQHGLTKGLPDLMCLAPGLPIGFIELKTTVGRISPAQMVFRSQCQDLGIPHAITRGRDEPIEVLRKWGVVR